MEESKVPEKGIVETRVEITFTRRLKHFTWAWFAFPLSTGQVALMLAATPHRFDGLTTIGKIFFIFGLTMFLCCTAAIAARFILYPDAFRCSFTHPTESLFFPTFPLNLANMLACAQVYGSPYCGPWYPVAMKVLFWMYIALAFTSAVLQYLYLFTAPTHMPIQNVTPAWILPIFPTMLAGTIAAVLAPDQPPTSRMPILVAGVTVQGLGWSVAFLMYAAYIQRLMSFGVPGPDHRPGMFIAVGPPSFTGFALIGLSNSLPEGYGYFATHTMAIDVLQTLAVFTAIFLWLLGLWYCCITLILVLAGIRKMSFHLVWWAAVFPNIAFVLATIAIGEQLESEGILWITSVLTVIFVALYLFVLIAHARAVLKKRIMMPGKDEDKGKYHQIQTFFSVFMLT